MKQIVNMIAWCIIGSITGVLGTWAFMTFQLYYLSEPGAVRLANHNMQRLSVLYSISSTFWLDWLITVGVSVIASFTVRLQLLLKVFAFSVFYIVTPWLVGGMPTVRGRGLLDMILFSASVPILATAAAGFTRHLFRSAIVTHP